MHQGVLQRAVPHGRVHPERQRSRGSLSFHYRERGVFAIPSFTPQCDLPSCIFCASPKTNLCPQIRKSQSKDVMPSGMSRFSVGGSTVQHTAVR